MFYLYQSPKSGRYRFYNDADHTFSIIGFTDIGKGYRHFCNCTLNGNYQELPSCTLIAASPTIDSFPDLYPELFI